MISNEPDIAPLACCHGVCAEHGVCFCPNGRCVRCGRIVDTTRLPKAIERERTFADAKERTGTANVGLFKRLAS